MISLHILVDNASPAVLERALLYLKRTKQRTVNIGAGAEILKGMQFVERVRAECPGIKIFWRNLDPEDTGIHTKMSPQSLFDKKVAPYLDWFKKNEIIFVCDNESSGDDNAIRRYAQWTVELLVIMHSHNLATAVCRFATGNIAEHQYVLLKPIFSAMLPFDWISPNEYSNQPGKSSGGHLERYKQMWAVAGKSLPTAIGEAGLCPDYDPGKGFRSIGMSGKDHAKQLINEEIWYGNGQIDRFLFVIGGFEWGDFQLIKEIGDGKVEADTLDALEFYYAGYIPPVESPSTPAFPIDFQERAEVGIVTSPHNLNVRVKPSIDAMSFGQIKPQVMVQFIPLDKLRPAEKIESTISGVTALWQPVRMLNPDNGNGWVWSGGVTWQTLPPFNEEVLKQLYNDVIVAATRIRQMSLEMASLSDDLIKDGELLKVLLKVQTNKG